MSLKRQWLLSILIVLLTTVWWVGRERDSPPHDGIAEVSQPAAVASAKPVGVAPSTSATSSAAPSESDPAATETADPFPEVTDHPLPTRRLLPAVPATTSGPHVFLMRNPDGTPVTWSPCAAIHYAVNSDEMPVNGMEVLHAAVDQVSAATGLKFVQDPNTHAVVTGNGVGLDIATDALYLPVLVSWATEQQYAPLAGNIAGVASPFPGSTDNPGMQQYHSGQITLDADYFRTAAAQGWTSEEQAIVMHELGHLVGLDHVQVPTELMNKDNVGLMHYGPGDLQGLAEAGNGRCTF